MRTRIFLAIMVLVGSSLACGMPDLSSVLNSLPSDDFSDSASGWGTGSDSQSSVQYANSGLQVIVYQPLYVTWSTPDSTSYENVHMDVRVRNDSTDPKAFFGLICDEQGTTNSFYYVGVSSDGYYAFIKSAVAQDDVILKKGNSTVVSSTDQSAINIGLDCGAGNLALYVNGQQIDSVSDSSYTSGGVGVFAASDQQPSATNVTFDNFAMTQLGK